MGKAKPMKVVCEIPYDLPESKRHANGPSNGEAKFLGLVTEEATEQERAALAARFPNYRFFADEAWDELARHPDWAELARHRGIRKS
jgi:hypothetical protein